MSKKDIYIDINCDLGEGIGNEKEILPLISSCNIACGGHFGDFETMSETVSLARKYNVKVGAHPSYPDRENFGRTSMDIARPDLIQSVQKQIEDFQNVLNKENMSLHHIKAHGALYNDSAGNKRVADTFLEAIDSYKNDVLLYVPYKSIIADRAIQKGFQIKLEAFADRNYNKDLSLVSRKLPDAVIQNPEKVLQHLIRMVRNEKIKTLDEQVIKIKAETYCVHGDSPMALKILNYLTVELPKNNILIKK